ncbi:MAG: stage III sporulation protein AE [Desulfitobacteriaceae bacterium]|nr:stage III sporulation protein AE [Desulfitobacteriaceae bacterium]MDD4346103.1 stage III sporulation protein AE [Desulfitobacteriaceae bacterium]MDD4401063.1 stage III sporulation protein AE [Desulfitobacteriaceae bacterium]
MRSMIYGIFFLLLIWTTPLPVLAEGTAVLPVAQIEGIIPLDEKADLANQVDLSQIRSFLENLDADVQKSLPEFSLSKIFEDLKEGKLSLQPDKLGKAILTFLGKEVLSSAPLIGKLLILAVLCAVLQQLQTVFSGEVGRMSQLLSYLVLMGIALAAFKVVIDISKDAVDQMVGLMQVLFPVLLTLLLAMGNLTTAALFKPLVMGSLTFLATLLKTLVLPLFFLGSVLRLFNNISEQFKLSKLAGLLDFAGKISLGFILTLFIGVMAVQGVTGGVADGVVLRTAKYSADMIPVVGKFFKDAVELVATSGLLLRNALGLIAILAIAIICLGPLVKILAMILTFRISAALVEPLGEKALADSLQDMANSLIYIFGAVASVTIMFFITIAIVVGTGNISIMLR